MSSEKTIIIGAIAVIAAAIGIFYFFILRNPNQNPLPQAGQQSLATSTAPSSGAPAFETNDNLDQALQDLNLIEK